MICGCTLPLSCCKDCPNMRASRTVTARAWQPYWTQPEPIDWQKEFEKKVEELVDLMRRKP